MYDSFLHSILSTFQPISKNSSVMEQLTLMMKRLIFIGILTLLVLGCLLFFYSAEQFSALWFFKLGTASFLSFLVGFVIARTKYTKRYIVTQDHVLQWVAPKICMDANLKIKERELAKRIEELWEYCYQHQSEVSQEAGFVVLSDSIEKAKQRFRQGSVKKKAMLKNLEGIGLCDYRPKLSNVKDQKSIPSRIAAFS